MADLFKQMYVNGIDFEAMTIEKLMDLVFTEMVYRKIQQLDRRSNTVQQRSNWRESMDYRGYFKALFDMSSKGQKIVGGFHSL